MSNKESNNPFGDLKPAEIPTELHEYKYKKYKDSKISILDFAEVYLGLKLTAMQKGYLQLIDFVYKNKPYTIPLARGQVVSYDVLYAMVRQLYDEYYKKDVAK